MHPTARSTSRRALALGIAVPFVIVALFGALLYGGQAAAQESTPTTEAGILDEPAAAINCDPSVAATPEAIQFEAPATTFAIVSEESEVRYVAQEELANVGANEAVGATQAFIGNVYFNADGVPLACTRFDADLRTLTSDEARRDNFLSGNTLETATYPLATFILTEVEGLDGALTDGEETTFTLIGNLSLHGVTKLVAWEATATLDGDTLTGSASTAFDMPDFEIEEPVVGPVISVDEHIVLEVDIVAEKAS
jgi:polyisoprenoid-binding protein YceI